MSISHATMQSKQMQRGESHPSCLCVFIFAIATQLTACMWGFPVDRGIDPVTITDRANWMNAAGMTRAEIIARIGEPWITDARHRVDVFRVSDKQHGVVVVFTPWPVPVPDIPINFRGYSLVSYAPNGIVEAADWAYNVDSAASVAEREHIKNVARAGDYVLEHPSLGGVKHVALGVTHARYLVERRADTLSQSNCTVLTVCGEFIPHLGWSVDKDVCWNRLRVDDKYVGHVVVNGQYSVPIRLAPGTHRLSFESKRLHGVANTTLSCTAGEVWYASFRSEVTNRYSEIQGLLRGGEIGEGTAQVMLTREPPPEGEPAFVLLNYGGKPVDGRGVDVE